MTGGNGSTGVAIVGIACRFPGAADHLAFWQNLCAGTESITALSDAELALSGVPTDRLRDPSYVKAASLLPDIEGFDAAFFEYSPEEARLMDRSSDSCSRWHGRRSRTPDSPLDAQRNRLAFSPDSAGS